MYISLVDNGYTEKKTAKIGMWSIENSAGFYVRWWSQLVHRKQRNDRVWKTGRCALWKITSSQGYLWISHNHDSNLINLKKNRAMCLSEVIWASLIFGWPPSTWSALSACWRHPWIHGKSWKRRRCPIFWSYPKSLYVIGFNTKSWSSITWSGVHHPPGVIETCGAVGGRTWKKTTS